MPLTGVAVGGGQLSDPSGPAAITHGPGNTRHRGCPATVQRKIRRRCPSASLNRIPEGTEFHNRNASTASPRYADEPSVAQLAAPKESKVTTASSPLGSNAKLMKAVSSDSNVRASTGAANSIAVSSRYWGLVD